MQSSDEDQIPAFLRKQPPAATPPTIDAEAEPGDDDGESEESGERADLVLDADLPSAAAWAGGVAPTSDRLLFPGDRGELRGETRRALVALLAGPSVDGERQPKLWLVLKRDEEVLRSRLSDLFLDLTVDDGNRVAFVRQVPQHGEADIPILLRRQPLTFLQSAGLLILRAALTNAASTGQRAVIGGAEFIADLGAYQDPASSDKARFSKQCAAVVETLKKVSILRPIPGSTDRYEVSPTLALLLPAEQLEALRATYERLRAERVSAEAR
ncbi:DUF4194 domain-containing protein [Ramlibacter rhizophilus]|uniref:DUF4194 domain-containing protein n=1 Tax=Ramlibacter rhizophilus TaxID=1781167 RepID=A0A4Z0C254_9BURK|nr:DUF4194 domain-containing protein [Ramlibacter rhizophilus]TFZ04578.1 DUF4194 domain-containing protein [Ramlibacter rhizophilus]